MMYEEYDYEVILDGDVFARVESLDAAVNVAGDECGLKPYEKVALADRREIYIKARASAMAQGYTVLQVSIRLGVYDEFKASRVKRTDAAPLK
jgi:hypothetical protein